MIIIPSHKYRGCLMISFTLDDEQEGLLRDWQKNHACKYRLKDGNRYTGTFGGADTFTFIPTSVEEVVIVKCADRKAHV